MKISFIDLCGFGLGPAIGLKELGYDVHYFGGESFEKSRNLLSKYKDELIVSVFGKESPPDPKADLLVVCDSFSDFKWALEEKIQLDAPWDPNNPFVRTINPLVYEKRLDKILSLCNSANAVCVIDGSDKIEPRENAFFSLNNALLLAREVPKGDANSKWIPFPYIYNFLILLLERTRERSSWFIPFEKRRYVWDWVFCGTINHPRYNNRRKILVEEVKRKWPRARFHILKEGSPFTNVLEVIQASLWGLDLPGGGELCFRLHEYLALGVPIFRPWPWSRVVVPEVEGITSPTIDLKNRPSGISILKVYEDYYVPKKAGEKLISLKFNL